MRKQQQQRSPAFQFYPRQFSGDDAVMAMDLDTVGAHILLMCTAAASPESCRIAAEDRAIRNRLRNPGDEDWKRIKQQLLDSGAWKLSPDGQWWIQDGLRRSFEKQKSFSESQRQRANKRYCPETTEGLPKLCPSAAETLPENCSSSSSSPKGESGDVISPEMIAQSVIIELGISGRFLLRTIAEVVKAELKAGRKAEQIRDSMIASHRHYERNVGKLWRPIDVEKFFGDGSWRNQDSWPWKDKEKLKSKTAERRYANGGAA